MKEGLFGRPTAARNVETLVNVLPALTMGAPACAYRGNCVEACPTGGLSATSEFDLRAAGTWDGSRQARTTTVCAYCGVGCNLTLHVQDNGIVEVTSPHDNQVTHGSLCIKGRFGRQHVQNRD